jgi:hypothetical protein
MKKFALVGGGRVANIVVAEDATKIGPAADAFIVVDITDMDAAPSVGSTYDRVTKKFAPPVPDNMKSLLTGDTLVLEAPAAPAPVAAKASSKKKSADEETPAEE